MSAVQFFQLGIAIILVCVSLAFAKDVELKINLGGEAVDGFTSEEEIVQTPESDNYARMRYHGTLKNGRDFPNVFKTQRFSRYEDLVLKIPVEDGVYKVSLLFAETWEGAFSAGKRVFDVRFHSSFFI